MRINSIPNTSFKAQLCGEYKKVMRLSIEGGLYPEDAEKAINQLHEVCPKDEDKVYLYFRKYKTDNRKRPDQIRSGVKVVKDGKVLELNVDPRDISQKNLLFKLVAKAKTLANGKAIPDDIVKYYSVPVSGWLSDLVDDDTKFKTTY